MTAKPRIKFCSLQCQMDGGQHFNEDEDGEIVVTRPHHDELKALQAMEAEHAKAVALSHQQNRDAISEARRIVTDIARTLDEISANDTRDALYHAHIPTALIGAAFDQLSKGDNPVLQATGRYVMSTDPNTRHRVQVYASRVYRRSVA